MTEVELTRSAYEAGRAGRSWASWCCEDAVQDFLDADDTQATQGSLARETNIANWKEAFTDGEDEHFRGRGWVERWTTAPEDYDSFGTRTLALKGEWKHLKLRTILCDPRHVLYQTDRYASGLHGTWETDPRVAEREAAERAAARLSEDKRRQEERDKGLARLKSASDADILKSIDTEICEPGLVYDDYRDERKRREALATDAIRIEEIQKCLDVVKEGMTLIDDGTPSTRSGWSGAVISGRPAMVYYEINIQPYVRTASADDIKVWGTRVSGKLAGSLASVAEAIQKGVYRVATPADDLPPEPVLRRVGMDRRKHVTRVDVGGVLVWVGYPIFAREPLVLDVNGKLVRSAKNKALALQMCRSAGTI